MSKVKNAVKKILKVHDAQIDENKKTEVSPAISPRTFVDVLFINGCDASVPHPPRYRVSHQREQLEANNISTDEIYYMELNAEFVKYANLFVIFRCPYTEEIGKLIKEAKRLNKKVLFDIDDLVVDTKYTDENKYVKQLQGSERNLYDDGVKRMGKTLALCDGAITTTKALAEELKKFVPEVYINRNVASEEMYALSLDAIKLKEENEHNDVVLDEERQLIVPVRKKNEIRIGYFSGSITHNDDVKLIMPTLVHILKKYPNVNLYAVGELDVPAELTDYSDQVITFPFLDWRKLPRLISMVDINLAPLEDNLFNRAKSENKWVEASLVETVTIASNVGAFQETIQNGKNGILCNESDWSGKLEELILHPELRKNVAKAAYKYVHKYYITLYSGQRIAGYVKRKIENTVVLVLPSTEISGGIMVALKHAEYIKKAGYNVSILAENPSLEWVTFSNERFPVVSWHVNPVRAYFRKAIATLWTTTEFLEYHPAIKERYYLVQGFETDLYDPGIILRRMANRTYSLGDEIQYLTISKWCSQWLKEDFGKLAKYVPDGLMRKNFPEHKRTLNGKIRILIEGDSSVSYKGVDESFSITNTLPSEKFEIWYMSYNGQAKAWYRVDKFLHRIPYDEVGKVYNQCDILLKSSWLESFSYPPLEMMATGGYVVAVQNGGNAEYMRHEENCLIYDQGNIEQAILCINRIIQDEELQEKLYRKGLEIAEQRDWANIKDNILSVYGI